MSNKTVLDAMSGPVVSVTPEATIGTAVDQALLGYKAAMT